MTLLSRVAFALLIAATLAAFFVAQRLKAEPGAIGSVRLEKFFSPNGDGNRDVEDISLRVKERDDVTVDIVDADNGRVRRIATAVAAQPFRPVRLTWDGKTDERVTAPDGQYRIRIGLRRGGRSVVYPSSFKLDTTPPKPAVIRTDPPVVAPGLPVSLLIRGAGPRKAPRFRVIRTDVEPNVTVRRFDGTAGSRRATWDGRTDDGSPAPLGTYLIAVTAEDRAGNVGTGPRLPPQPGRVEGRPGVTVRGLAITPPVRPVQAGQDVLFLIDARGESYRWQVRRLGEPRPRKRSDDRKSRPTLQFKAPGGKSGVYLLEVRSGRYSASVPFAVQAAERSKILVVLPMMAWLGRDPVDDPRRPDGIPNTLENGSVVRYPRFLVGDEGLPRHFATEVAPLLVYLDRSKISYDVTTDLALARSRDPRATDREGVLFAGRPSWVSRSTAKRLRRYVSDGGRVAVFGPDALRASVSVGTSRLTRATPPGPADAFGGRIAPLRRLPELAPEQPARLTTLQDNPNIQVFRGFDGTLDRPFPTVEELISPGDAGEVTAGIGQALTDAELAEAEAANKPPREERPAITATKLGKGYVFRVGVPDWVPALAAGDAEANQLTRNVLDLLRRATPRVRSPLR